MILSLSCRQIVDLNGRIMNARLLCVYAVDRCHSFCRSLLSPPVLASASSSSNQSNSKLKFLIWNYMCEWELELMGSSMLMWLPSPTPRNSTKEIEEKIFFKMNLCLNCFSFAENWRHSHFKQRQRWLHNLKQIETADLNFNVQDFFV